MSVAQRKACCCHADPPCGDGMCPAGSLYRAACGGAHQYVQKFEMSGGTSGTNTNSIPFSMPVTGFGSGLSPATSFSPFRAALNMTLSLSEPAAPPGPQSASVSDFGNFTWQGIYKRLTVNGSTYTFDGLVGLGVTLDSATITTSHDTTAWPNFPTSERLRPDVEIYAEIVSDLAVLGESINFVAELQAGPNVSGGSGNYFVSLNTNGTGTLQAKMAARNFQVDSAGTHHPEGTLPSAATTTLGLSVEAFSSNTDYTDVCHGFMTTADLTTADSTVIGSLTGGLVSPSDADHGVSVEDFAIRSCPCAIRVTGTLYTNIRTDTGVPASSSDPPKLDPDSEDYEVPPMAMGPGEVDLRLTRFAGKGCGHPSGQWTGAGTMTFGESEPLTVSDVEVRRCGPRLYRLTGTIEGVETFDGESNSNSGANLFTLFYTVDGDCPTSVASVEQFAQVTTIVTTSGEPVLQLQNPAVTDVFTANDLNVEQVERETGDPACGCNESTPYQTSSLAAARVQSVLDDDSEAAA